MTTDPNPDPRVKNLRDAQRRLRSVLIANADRLDKPFTDDPDKNPWDTYVRPAMRELKSAVDAIAAPAAAVPVAAPPTTEQTALRERVAEALATADGWKWGPGLGLDNAFSSVIERYRGRADAVLAVLPASADRAAALREAADGLIQLRDSLITEPDVTGKYLAGIERSASLLRRLAVEAGQAGGPSRETTEPQPETQTGADLLALVRDFLDPDPCSFDHHGYCQAHAAGFGGEPLSCPHGRARKLLAAAAAPVVSSRPGTEQEA